MVTTRPAQMTTATMTIMITAIHMIILMETVPIVMMIMAMNMKNSWRH